MRCHQLVQSVVVVCPSAQSDVGELTRRTKQETIIVLNNMQNTWDELACGRNISDALF